MYYNCSTIVIHALTNAHSKKEIEKMKSNYFSVILFLGIHALFVLNTYSDSTSAEAVVSKLGRRPLVYKSRTPNTKSLRVDGNNRVQDASLPAVYVLAPDHVGYTIMAQPTLYWYQSAPTQAQIELGIIGEDKTEVMFKITKKEAVDSGIQNFSLSEHNIRLKKKVQYKWYVSIIPNPKHPSRDIVASGLIERMAPPELVSKNLRKSKDDLVYILAEEGIWYDASGSYLGRLYYARTDKRLIPGNKS